VLKRLLSAQVDDLLLGSFVLLGLQFVLLQKLGWCTAFIKQRIFRWL